MLWVMSKRTVNYWLCYVSLQNMFKTDVVNVFNVKCIEMWKHMDSLSTVNSCIVTELNNYLKMRITQHLFHISFLTLCIFYSNNTKSSSNNNKKQANWVRNGRNLTGWSRWLTFDSKNCSTGDFSCRIGCPADVLPCIFR